MKKILVLIWEGVGFPDNTMNADVVVHQDPSCDSDTIDIRVMKKDEDIISVLESIFPDETFISNDDFYVYQGVEALKGIFSENFNAHFVESEMTPQFINGGRVTTFSGNPLN